MSSWCPRCGYYPTLSEDRQAVGLDAAAESEADEDEPEPQNLLQVLPVWVWVTLGGVFAVFGTSVAIRVTLDRSGGDATAFGWPMLIGGLITVVTAHGIALRHAMSCDRRVTLNDGLIAWFTVWQPTIADLPETRRRLWALVWGGTAVLCAVAVVGGITMDWLLKPGEKHKFEKDAAVTGAIADAAAAQQPDAATLEEALEQVADRGEDAQEPPVASAEPENELTGTIFGFQANRNGVPLNFLFSGITRHRRQHVATISTERLSDEMLRVIVMRLHNTLRRTPATPTIYSARWVEPLVECRLKYDSIAENGTLVNPAVLEVLRRAPVRPGAGGRASDDSRSGASDPTGSADTGAAAGSTDEATASSDARGG